MVDNNDLESWTEMEEESSGKRSCNENGNVSLQSKTEYLVNKQLNKRKFIRTNP